MTSTIPLIAHRGNTHGPQRDLENRPDYIDAAIRHGFQVEIDLWGSPDSAFLGHDGPQYQVELDWLSDRQEQLWVHCKNDLAMSYVAGSALNWFYHEADAYTLTSQGFIWAYPGKRLPKGRSVGLWFEPESPLGDRNYQGAYAICGDYVGTWEKGVVVR